MEIIFVYGENFLGMSKMGMKKMVSTGKKWTNWKVWKKGERLLSNCRELGPTSDSRPRH